MQDQQLVTNKHKWAYDDLLTQGILIQDTVGKKKEDSNMKNGEKLERST